MQFGYFTCQIQSTALGYIKVTGGDTVTFNQMKSQDDFKKRLKQNIPNFAVI